MNRDYAERRIREALKTSGGNATTARQKVINWAIEDPRLLQELVAPHLTGIVAHAVNRVMTAKEKPAPIKEPAAAKVPPSAKSDPFGMEILKAIALGNPAQFGQESGVSMKKQPASQRHIDAIRQMVSKDKKSGK
ncbi:MAG: hypothetical protein DI551_00840 [Micavibrio aeruginosavorus]|uniref:Uncharacterized protein n=1 Tax=Micavibrio aeruginosavorus TaxID=349221 RepID=A0A2W5N8N7_9BACT|nr:MAG: hypothetical protein DI551_00840 [Micavibrio aeruginosavorus]